MIRKKKSTKLKTIVICSSASFYKQALETEKSLKRLGFKVSLPISARTMEKTNNYDSSFYKPWFKNPANFKRKAFLMRDHFNKVLKADSVLVINLDKDGKKNYIGGNVLAEMAFAFYFKKPIFVLNEIPKNSPFYEEVFGMNPVFLQGDLSKIK